MPLSEATGWGRPRLRDGGERSSRLRSPWRASNYGAANRCTHLSRSHPQGAVGRYMNCQVRARLMLRTKLLRCRRNESAHDSAERSVEEAWRVALRCAVSLVSKELWMLSLELFFRDSKGLELGLVQNRRCSGDGSAGRLDINRVSNMNSIRLAVIGSFSEAFYAISLGPEAIRNRGVFRMGRAEITRAKTTHIKIITSVDSVCHQPTSGPGSRVSNCPF